MDIALWIAASGLILIFLPAGLLKLTQPIPALVDKGQAWAEDTPRLVKPVGYLELLGVVGLTLPWLNDSAAGVGLLAAIGFALMMVGAMVIHGRRREWPNLGVNVVIAVVSIFVAAGYAL